MYTLMYNSYLKHFLMKYICIQQKRKTHHSQLCNISVQHYLFCACVMNNHIYKNLFSWINLFPDREKDEEQQRYFSIANVK